MGGWGVNPMESAHFLSIAAFTFVVALIVAEFAGLFVFSRLMSWHALPKYCCFLFATFTPQF